MTDSPTDLRSVLDGKLAELAEMAQQDADAYLIWRRRFERLHFALGIPAAVLAAAAGATAFAETVPSVVVGSCAAIAAALAGIQTLIRPDRRATFNQAQQFQLAKLAMDASKFRELTLPTAPFEEAQAKLDAFYDAYYAARTQSPS